MVVPNSVLHRLRFILRFCVQGSDGPSDCEDVLSSKMGGDSLFGAFAKGAVNKLAD